MWLERSDARRVHQLNTWCGRHKESGFADSLLQTGQHVGRSGVGRYITRRMDRPPLAAPTRSRGAAWTLRRSFLRGRCRPFVGRRRVALRRTATAANRHSFVLNRQGGGAAARAGGTTLLRRWRRRHQRRWRGACEGERRQAQATQQFVAPPRSGHETTWFHRKTANSIPL
jgi:hypothetical protein